MGEGYISDPVVMLLLLSLTVQSWLISLEMHILRSKNVGFSTKIFKYFYDANLTPQPQTMFPVTPFSLPRYCVYFTATWSESELVLLSAMWDELDDDDYEDPGASSLQRVWSTGCQCSACQQRRGNCEMLTVRSGSIVMLPAVDDDSWTLYLQTMIDKDSLQYLNEKRVINWCKGAYKLYPMRTTGKILIFINIHTCTD